MLSKPLFTIVTVTYNAVSCVGKTIQSVLSQSFSDFEYIIVDGGSSDGTVEEIKKADKLWDNNNKLKWISEPDRGIYDGMNKAINMAIGEYLLFLNADDTFVSDNVLQSIYPIISSCQADVYYGSWISKTEYGEYHKEPGEITLLDHKWVISHQATFVRTSLLKENPFDLKFRLCADFNQLSYFYTSGKTFKYIPIEIASIPIDSGSSFSNFAMSKREHYQIVSARGKGNRLQTEWMILRIGCVHLLKKIMPKNISNCFFRLLAKYYKVM